MFSAVFAHVVELASVGGEGGAGEVGGVDGEALGAIDEALGVVLFLFFEEFFPGFVIDKLALGFAEFGEAVGAVGEEADVDVEVEAPAAVGFFAVAVGGPEDGFAVPGPLGVEVVVAVFGEVDHVAFSISGEEEDVFGPAVFLEGHDGEAFAIGGPLVSDVAIGVGVGAVVAEDLDGFSGFDIEDHEVFTVLEVGDGFSIGGVEGLEGFVVCGEEGFFGEDG